MGSDQSQSGSLGSHNQSYRSLGIGLVVGSIALGACQNNAIRNRSNDSKQPVNSTLGSIASEQSASDPGLALPDSDELMNAQGERRSVRDQIEESTRLLDVYFANMEIDGVDPDRDQEVAQWGSEGTGTESGEQPIDTGEVKIGKDPDPRVLDSSPETDDPGTVRVSLMSSGDDEQSDEVTGDSGEQAQELNDNDLNSDESGAEPDQVDTQSNESVEPIDPALRKEELANELAGILRELAMTSENPGSAALALASLETILPNEIDDLVESGVLSQGEGASIHAVRAFLGSLSKGDGLASPQEVSDQLASIQRDLNAWSGLVVSRAALCTQVNGYGRYETFPSYRFQAGRSQEAIVYVELDRFSQEENLGPDGLPRYRTQFSQRLELYHVGDDLNVWNDPIQVVTDEARNRVRDFYVINKITLPSNLGVGRYHLKIVMRDLIADRSAETIIPIELLARP